MPALATAVTQIRSDLNRGSDFDARIKTAIENAIKHYRAKRLGFNTKRTGYATASEFTSLTADWLEVDSFRMSLSGERVPIGEKSFLWMDEQAYSQSLSSEPVYFAVQDRQLRLWPPPDQTYSFVMAGLYDLTNVSACASDSSSNKWMTEGFELVKMHAMVEVLETYIDGPEAIAKADRLRLREQQEYRQLKSRANREQSSGKVEAWL